MAKRNSTQYPPEFLNCFLQANLAPVEWNMPSQSKAMSYRNYLYQFRRAYIDEARPNHQMLETIVASITGTDSANNVVLALHTRKFIEPKNNLQTDVDALVAAVALKQSLEADDERSQEEIIKELEAEGMSARDKADMEDAVKNPYLE